MAWPLEGRSSTVIVSRNITVEVGGDKKLNFEWPKVLCQGSDCEVKMQSLREVFKWVKVATEQKI